METNTDNNSLLAETYTKINAVPTPKPQFDTALEWYTKEMTCAKCGHKSKSRVDVSLFNNYIGGQGYVWQEECVDIPACSDRRGWDGNLLRGKK